MEPAPPSTASDGRTAPEQGSARVDVFLCHNSLDKPFVRQVAEGLELEFGIPHFLDADAIPSGVEFLKWIDEALAKAKGCAIFLGANGWGSTHFWEAERALDRYRKDPDFRLIPVALPGIREEDMRRLGSGSVFVDINWADFRGGSFAPDAIRKLRAALRGEVPDPTQGGPAQLTPYLIRRDARRWEESQRRNKSILYRGRQLADAEALRRGQPDLVAGEAILAFLAASAGEQTWRARRTTALAVIAAVIIAGLALRAEFSRRLALSRFVAAEARQAASPDVGLRLALQATRISETPEAFGALLERLDAQPYLRQMFRVSGTSVDSLAFDTHAGALYAGLSDGHIERIDLGKLRQTRLTQAGGAAVLALDVEGTSSEVWAGLQDGRVVVYPVNAVAQNVAIPAGAALDVEGGPVGRRWPIVSLRVSPDGKHVAIGTHDSRLIVLDRAARKVRWIHRTSAQRVTALSFSVDSARLAAGSSEGLVESFDSVTGAAGPRVSTAASGEPKAMQFARTGELRVIDNGMKFSVFARDAQPRTSQLPGEGLSTAAVGPAREFGPMQRRDHFVLGFGSGDVALTPVSSPGGPVTIAAHARSVRASALSAEAALAATGADDGSVAVWDLRQRSPLVKPQGVPGSEVIALAYTNRGALLAVGSSPDSASLATRSSAGWQPVMDLMDLVSRLAGPETAAAKPAVADRRGFVELPDKVVTMAAFNAMGRHLLLTTREGALLWIDLATISDSRMLHSAARGMQAIALSDSGRFAFSVDADGDLVRFDTWGATATLHHRLRTPVRQLVAAANEQAVMVTLEDGSLHRVDFSRSSAAPTTPVELPGTAGQLVRLPGSDLLLVAGAGSSAGVDIGVVRKGRYQRLHSRRVGGAASALALSGPAGIVAATDFDGQLHLWDLETLAPMASLKLSADKLVALAAAPDGRRLAIATQSGDVYELSLDRERWREVACDVARSELSEAEWRALVPDTQMRQNCPERHRPGTAHDRA